MSEKYLDPAKSIVAKFGAAKCAELTGKHVSRVYRWMASREKGGTGGFVPYEDALTLLAAAPSLGIELSHSEFFPNVEASQ